MQEGTDYIGGGCVGEGQGVGINRLRLIGILLVNHHVAGLPPSPA